MGRNDYILRQRKEIVLGISRALVEKFGAKTEIVAEMLCGKLGDLERTIDITPYLAK